MDDDQYGLSDLRQLISTRTGHFSAVSHPLEPFPGHRSSLPLFDPIHHAVQHQYAPLPTGHAGFAAAVPPSTSSAAAASLFAVDMDCGRGGCLMEGGNSRWPRQETLTLLEIRSRLDPKFREANHKGPLWEEVSRIMSEEHGYQRSGKKCREKFENLYKYYKKTKEGKAGRQDGKNYRFFRQLEAIYGDPSSIISTNNHTPHESAYINSFQDQPKPPYCENNHSFSISNSSHDNFDTSSSENNEEYDLSAVAFMMSQSRDNKKKKKHVGVDDTDRPIEGFKRRSSGWKEKVKSFVDSQMKKVIERQEIWMDSIVKSFEQREQERVLRETEWKKQETERFDREHAMWAKERAWIVARDAALMEALKNKLTGQGLVNVDFSLSRDQHHFHSDEMNGMVEGSGNETEILRLIQLRTGMEPRFQECGYNSSSSEDQGLWEVIAAKMGCMGHNLTAVECKDKWENIRTSFVKLTTDHHSDRSSKG